MTPQRLISRGFRQGVVSRLYSIHRSTTALRSECGSPQVDQIRTFFELEIKGHMRTVNPEDLIPAEKTLPARSVASAATPINEEALPLRRSKKVRATRTQNESGYCIRCAGRIQLNPQRPYCLKHFEKWAEYSNEDYEDSTCHVCGTDHAATMRKPLCPGCFGQA